ncbi:hypothetical protein CB0940_01468 [Cercospora beticola]|uniref:Heterokaryon incompatibility domain-containing protein n=1 Tax=Cercospora beticola TaxID=122368 RepID=A0A2G5IC33_CERBT|nr:hypothetical protein CB0940_01468 [Cercospora beticola]PIB02416.1 hypothetical protein CB0940_01468 [Cercospora beticola]WPA96906.1 hypothetical protein RHO25_001514 [Cercospora beticola]
MSLARYTSRTNSGQDTQNFHYERLRDTKNGIRLAKIRPGSGNKRVAIDLVESWLPQSGQQAPQIYDALSYTWGDASRTKTILCNDRRLVVTENLHEALFRFRDPMHPVTLWIDQICIWQDSLPERNAQVKMMGEIFLNARKVLVWLGDHYDDSQAGMQLAEQLRLLCGSAHPKSSLDTPGLPRRGDRKWKALAAILRRPWFWRTWIVQEIVLNPVVELVLGGSTLLWDDLEAIVSLLDEPSAAQWHQDPTASAWELPFSRINRIRRRHQQLHATAVSLRKPQADQANDMDLLDLLLMSRDLGATDPRDKVFALLGLSNHDLEPDYQCSPEHIFTEFALHVIGEASRSAGSDAKISRTAKEARHALILLSCAGYHNRDSPLQSWVPDWTTDLLSRPFVFDPRFRAGGDELEIDWNYETGLQLCGKLLDTVSVAGDVRLLGDSVSDARDSIERWGIEARQISNARIALSPGSTAKSDAYRGLRSELGLCRHGYYTGQSAPASPSNPHKPRRRRSLIDEHDLAEELDDPHNARLTLTLGPTRGRVFFGTTTGYIGLAPHGTIEGDLVYIILGSGVPYVLRPQTDGTFKLIGEAYVQGVMNGEALAMEQWTAPQDVFIR